MLLYLIGERSRQLRKSKGLTQEELAEEAGLNSSYLDSVERGDRNISIETLEKIINGLNVTPTEMFQFHQIVTEEQRTKKEEALETVNSLFYNRSLEEAKLIYCVIKDNLYTLDSANN